MPCRFEIVVYINNFVHQDIQYICKANNLTFSIYIYIRALLLVGLHTHMFELLVRAKHPELKRGPKPKKPRKKPELKKREYIVPETMRPSKAPSKFNQKQTNIKLKAGPSNYSSSYLDGSVVPRIYKKPQVRELKNVREEIRMKKRNEKVEKEMETMQADENVAVSESINIINNNVDNNNRNNKNYVNANKNPEANEITYKVEHIRLNSMDEEDRYTFDEERSTTNIAYAKPPKRPQSAKQPSSLSSFIAANVTRKQNRNLLRPMSAHPNNNNYNNNANETIARPSSAKPSLPNQHMPIQVPYSSYFRPSSAYSNYSKMSNDDPSVQNTMQLGSSHSRPNSAKTFDTINSIADDNNSLKSRPQSAMSFNTKTVAVELDKTKQKQIQQQTHFGFGSGHFRKLKWMRNTKHRKFFNF